ncbi:MAG TPA: UDP-N-acetylmuramoyl-tripeptide--D-alanyl-D-alanine ligase [Bacteroidia bacterium]|nr:UDP-N-acetylmuramoyl-tripeptide--D-alanyl-D-alanine ligase [Bacteroidia bacterium]
MAFVSTEELYTIFLRYPKISTDTRAIQPGSIFFALRGANFNGNLFVKEALEKGAAYAVADEIRGKDDRVLPVPDVLFALQELGRHHREQLGKKGLKVLALTGSNGKTTTKELLARVLSRKFRTLFTEGNLNNQIGVPLTLLRLTTMHEMAVIEMGANHRGEIAMLCTILFPDYGLITNIGLAHLEGFGGPEGVLKGKTELFRFLEKRDGTAFVFADDPNLVDAAQKLNTLTYGTGEDAAISGKLLSTDPFVKFEWKKYGERYTVQTQLLGGYNLPNLLAACAVGSYFAIPPEQINEAIAAYIPSNTRSQLEEAGTNTLILDYYNANPSSMEAAIENFAKIPAEKKLLILGDMFELGEVAAAEHQRIVDLAGEKVPGAMMLLIGKLFAATEDDFNTVRLPDAVTAAEWLQTNMPENTLILIKGSRGMKLEQCADVLMKN